MKHTKGNWAICGQTETQIFIASTEKGARTEEGKGGYICQIKQEREHGGLTVHDEANAKVICAAPEMLEVLTSTFKRLWELRDSETICEQDREIIIDIETTMLNTMVAAGYEYKNANAQL